MKCLPRVTKNFLCRPRVIKRNYCWDRIKSYWNWWWTLYQRFVWPERSFLMLTLMIWWLKRCICGRLSTAVFLFVWEALFTSRMLFRLLWRHMSSSLCIQDQTLLEAKIQSNLARFMYNLRCHFLEIKGLLAALFQPYWFLWRYCGCI